MASVYSCLGSPLSEPCSSAPRPWRRRSTSRSRAVSVASTAWICVELACSVIISSMSSAPSSEIVSPKVMSESSPPPSAALVLLGEMRCSWSADTRAAVRPARSPIWDGVGFSPSSSVSSRFARLSRVTSSCTCAGSRTVRLSSAITRWIPCRIHQCTYVLSLNPREASYFSTPLISPSCPTCTRSSMSTCVARSAYCRAMDHTRRVLASTIRFLAAVPRPTTAVSAASLMPASVAHSERVGSRWRRVASSAFLRCSCMSSCTCSPSSSSSAVVNRRAPSSDSKSSSLTAALRLVALPPPAAPAAAVPAAPPAAATKARPLPRRTPPACGVAAPPLRCALVGRPRPRVTLELSSKATSTPPAVVVVDDAGDTPALRRRRRDATPGGAAAVVRRRPACCTRAVLCPEVPSPRGSSAKFSGSDAASAFSATCRCRSTSSSSSIARLSSRSSSFSSSFSRAIICITSLE
mmetsp:Transcript_23938/g.77784  ORF Transcript_23938/g.77784 Transcript_23938/m.77784 type:complete len:466 (+) Transcript_23938:191-1588(+)